MCCIRIKIKKMNINEDGLDLIKSFETLMLSAYICPAGIPTIGWGHTLNVKMGTSISREQADNYLKSDVSASEREVNRLVKSKLTENQFSALVSFVYNCGPGNFQKSTLLKKVNINPNDKSIETEFYKWSNGGGKVLNGLIRRRKAEASLYFKS